MWLTGLLGLPGAFACGPFFPNQLLRMGDEAVLEAPVADFHSEIARVEWPGVAEYARQASTEFDPRSTAEVDVADLRAALGDSNLALVTAYSETREALDAHLKAKATWMPTRIEIIHEGEEVRFVEIAVPPLPNPRLRVPKGVPAEFAYYLRGAIAFHEGQLTRARTAWEMVLTLPPEQRRHRSTWAAFMLGKTHLKHDPARAVEYFQRVRQFAKEGFNDSLRLAVDSLGWEARVELDRKHYERAMELYFCQNAAGDSSAGSSLRVVASALAGESEIVVRRAARRPLCRHLMLAWIISRERHDEEWIETWLDAVERSGARDVRGAERLAWASYQLGDVAAARRWLSRAPEQSPATQWVRAKLLLRDGRVEEATSLLGKLVGAFPEAEDWHGAYKAGDSNPYESRPTPDQVAGELGVLKLSRGQYAEALDLLLRANYPLDAAYVAERVLTTDELIAFVDRRWPQPTLEGTPGSETRYLLARRLARAGRWVEAKRYFPAALAPAFDSHSQAMESAKNCALNDEERAEWLWEAAKLTRWWGMSLIGTEIEPDWHAFGGSFELDAISFRHADDAELVPPSTEEQLRAARSKAQPGLRFHYRYRAAELAWEAAQLLPDDSDATAHVLCEAGSWLKLCDPKAADRFYKALVRRCRKTDMGDEADRRRWFPPLTEPEMPSTLPRVE